MAGFYPPLLQWRHGNNFTAQSEWADLVSGINKDAGSAPDSGLFFTNWM